MSQFFKLSKKNAVNEQTQHPSINPSKDKGAQLAAPSRGRRKGGGPQPEGDDIGRDGRALGKGEEGRVWWLGSLVVR